MKKRIRNIFNGLLMVCLCLTMLLTLPMQAQASDGSSYVYDGYTYDFHGNAKESPAMFQLERIISKENMGGVALSSVDDETGAYRGRCHRPGRDRESDHAERSGGRVHS